MKSNWWPKSPEEALKVLVKLAQGNISVKRFGIRVTSLVMGLILFPSACYFWEIKGSNVAGWLALVVLGATFCAIESDRVHEIILRVPLTEKHLNDFEALIKSYESAGHWGSTKGKSISTNGRGEAMCPR